MIRLIIITFSICVFSACSTSSKEAPKENQVDEKFMPSNDSEDLSTYEYVCNHCQIGSHEAGECPCGMQFEKNNTYIGVKTIEHKHENHEE